MGRLFPGAVGFSSGRFCRAALLAALLCAAGLSLSGSAGQVEARFRIDTGQRAHPISPYVYGNNQANLSGGSHGITITRLGGNRWTAYNWETNASNAGSDYHHQNDGYLGGGDVPGEAVRKTVAAAQQAGVAAIVTVPCAGYVSADKNEDRDVNKTPSYLAVRFKVSVPRKGRPFTLPPDARDDRVYQDEFVHWLRTTFPKAGRGAPPILYSLDNEPDLWSSTHARIHPGKLTYAEIVQRNTDYASAIKAVDPEATVFGPINYGWHGYTHLQDAPDRNGRDFLEFYLAAMKDAERKAGNRLLDVLDLHYYPEARGGNVRVTEGDAAPSVVAARLQATRSLWDPGYQEESWITRDSLHAPIRLLPRTQEKIAKFYPGTKLAITEYNFGAGGHISGALAQADALGIFGREDLFAALWWQLGRDRAFTDAAFAMYRSYDGRGGSFGDTSVLAETSDAAQTSVYASVDAGKPGRLVVVAINKTDHEQPAAITLTHSKPLARAEVYQLTAAAPSPKRAPDLCLSGRELRCSMPAMSVSTLVLRP